MSVLSVAGGSQLWQAWTTASQWASSWSSSLLSSQHWPSCRSSCSRRYELSPDVAQPKSLLQPLILISLLLLLLLRSTGCTAPPAPASRRPSRSSPRASCPTRRSRRPPLMPPPGLRKDPSRSRSDWPRDLIVHLSVHLPPVSSSSITSHKSSAQPPLSQVPCLNTTLPTKPRGCGLCNSHYISPLTWEKNHGWGHGSVLLSDSFLPRQYLLYTVISDSGNLSSTLPPHHSTSVDLLYFCVSLCVCGWSQLINICVPVLNIRCRPELRCNVAELSPSGVSHLQPSWDVPVCLSLSFDLST